MQSKNKKYKIGIVCYPTYGGSGVVATELGMALANKGHEVHFISYNQPFRLDVFSNKINFHEVSVPDYPLFEFIPYEHNLTAKLVDVAIHEKLDFLHVHYAIPHASAALSAKQILASKGMKLPIITTLHGTDITLLGKDKSFKSVIEFAINNSDAVTAVSKSLRKDTMDSFNIQTAIKVIPNFIDSNLYHYEQDDVLRNSFAYSTEKIIIHISNFRKVKRVQDVLNVFAKINESVPSKLLLIGDGPERLKMEQLCRNLGLCDSIRFIGKLKVVEKVLSVSDLFLLPSATESFGLVALEAMACKVAVISSNSGGLPEVNIDGKTGFLLDVKDVDGMVEKAIYLLKNPSILENFKQNAYKHAMEFDLPNILPLYEQIYQQLSK
ncbi:MAG: N-acetyl-alpha-D-glucosaminyl L-malate synthase BshA [Flavobacteriales bacterium TMED123]|nr:MAG: N-acetyl-alpha-D-glucosaminyl L-malate synthase BshA [Flavobacteriales bacterium TMED123]|tara:strand:- start:5466 stop:6608 length:1143 start_codon:yes stop_codon:yes gene_type:complete